MAIIGNISLNSVNQLPGPPFKYWVNLNITATSSHTFDQLIVKVDGVQIGTPEDISGYGLTYGTNHPTNPKAIDFSLITDGQHTVEVILSNSLPESQSFLLAGGVYTDTSSPNIINFSKRKISKVGASYLVEFDVHVQDSAGVKRVDLKRVGDPSNDTYVENSVGITDHIQVQTINVPIATVPPAPPHEIEFELEAFDYSSNSITSSRIKIPFVTQTPTITNFHVTEVTQTATDYVANADITVVFSTFADIDAYSYEFQNTSAVWQPYLASGGTVTIPASINISKTNPAVSGYKLNAYARDSFGNISTRSEILFNLDDVAPEGGSTTRDAIELLHAEKVGPVYTANLDFYATDASPITHWSWSDIGPADLDNNWQAISPPNVSFHHQMDYVLGSSGSKVVYAKFRDFSGNESLVHSINMNIDTISPDSDFMFTQGELRGDGNYDANFYLTASDNDSINFIKFYGTNNTTSAIISGHTNDWQPITGVSSLSETRTLVIPSTESEDELKFYYQVRDLYGNESPLKTVNVQFDKNKPTINSLSYSNVIKYASEYRIYTEIEAVDNYGITSYRYGFGDISSEPWTFASKSTHMVETFYIDVPVPADLNVTKVLNVEVRDAFGNISDIANTIIRVNDDQPTGNVSFAGSTLDTNDYILEFDLVATDTEPTDNVYWYSLVANDMILRDWKKLPNTGSSIAETVELRMPRTNDGRQDFYVRFADFYKNESPVYKEQVDLDAITVVGSISLNSVSLSGGTYTANVYLDAIDNNRVASYIIADSESGNVQVEHAILPPQKIFQKIVPINIGSTPNEKTVTVIYKDTFDNQSAQYELKFDLDNTGPSVIPQIGNITQNTTHRFFPYDLEMKDDYALNRYKFWDSKNDIEPTTWSSLPNSNNVIASAIFTVPITDTSPKFSWKVEDFFQNANTGFDQQFISSIPPTAKVSANTLSPIYSIGSINVGVDYDVYAAGTSKVKKLDIDVNSGYHTETLNFIPTISNQKGTYWFEYPIGTSHSDITVYPTSNYNYSNSTPTTLTTLFDGVAPIVSNTAFIGSYFLGSDFVLQIKIEGHDVNSGIRKIILHDPAGHMANVEQLTSLTHNVNHIYPFSIANSYPYNNITPTVFLEDLLGNRSSGNTLPTIPLDSSGPILSNIQINSNTIYDSAGKPLTLTSPLASNTRMIDVSFDATDVSSIEYYHFSRNLNEPFNSSTWTAVTVPAQTVSVSETVDLESDIGLSDGVNDNFFIHVRDRFTNISRVGGSFEYDRTPPSTVISFSNRIERETISGTEYFVVPYDFSYTSNYAEVLYKNENHNIGGIDSALTTTLLPTEEIANNYTETYKLPVSNYGPTKINVSVIDRFKQQSSNSSFTVTLEDIPPQINDVKINNGANYTNQANVMIRVDMSDNEGVCDYLFSNTANLVWDSPGWAPVPYGPHASRTESFLVDLEAIGFEQGVCNVYSYVKDFCQNTANTITKIIYDKEPPVISGLKIDPNWTRTATTYQLTLNAYAYDVTSGLTEFYISQNRNETIYQPAPGTPPIIGTSNTLFQDVQHVSVRDVGQKYFYFQAKDAAGNVSEQANTTFYIDAVAPVASYFTTHPTPQKFYLNEVANTFYYAISDDYALATLSYHFDAFPSQPLRDYSHSLTLSDSGDFETNISTLSEGEHTIFLTITDSYENRVDVPYEFHYDNTPPSIDNFDFREVRPQTSAPCVTYDVEFLIQSEDSVGIDYYELYDNDVLVATWPVKDQYLRISPTLEVPLTSLVPKAVNPADEWDVQLVLVEDDEGSKICEIYALVDGPFADNVADKTKLKKIISSISGTPQSEMNLHLETSLTNINNLKRSTIPSDPQTLDAAIPALDTTQFMIGSYAIVKVQSEVSVSGVVPFTSLMDYMKNNSSYYYEENTTASTHLRYNKIVISNILQNASSEKELHRFTLKVYDYAGNMSEKTIEKIFHDGTALRIEDYLINNLTSDTDTIFGYENFTANLISNVIISDYAFSIHPTIDFHSAYWVHVSDFGTPNEFMQMVKSFDTSEFSLGDLNDKIWLHAKDDNGNITSESVELIITTDAPVINNVTSPIILVRQGNYYVGDLTFTINDDSSEIEAYAVGFEKDPSNFKSIFLASSGTIIQKFKIPAKDIDGSRLMYVRLRDTDGNISSNYRVSIRVLDFEFEKFEVSSNHYLVGSLNNINVLFDIDSNPLDLKYGYMIDDSNEPISWQAVTPVTPNSIGEFLFTFNLDVSTIPNGSHDLYVWLKSKEGEKEFRKVSFISEQVQTRPYGTLIVKKMLNDGMKKKIWLEANLFDDGVGVAEYSLVDSVNTQTYESINIIQNRKITKLFEYDALANTTNTFNLDIKDATGCTSITVIATVDLSSVY